LLSAYRRLLASLLLLAAGAYVLALVARWIGL
jgi:hypothetical protein